MEKDFYGNGNDTENEVFMLSVFSFPYFRPVLSPAYHVHSPHSPQKAQPT